MADLLLKNACLPDGRTGIDLVIDGGHIRETGQKLTVTATQTIDLQGHLLLPGFVESHLHLDLAVDDEDFKRFHADGLHLNAFQGELNGPLRVVRGHYDRYQRLHDCIPGA